MEDGLAEAVDDGKVGPRDDPKARCKILAEEFGCSTSMRARTPASPPSSGPPRYGASSSGAFSGLQSAPAPACCHLLGAVLHKRNSACHNDALQLHVPPSDALLGLHSCV